ncbi:MAG: peptide-methionine (R)-S-oxide reductase MsrB [Verrucomicrobia bacterium]|nr:peptide-methionine (R)-S-oxide reductase MsrB [Verrucomicrobiota bacterium]
MLIPSPFSRSLRGGALLATTILLAAAFFARAEEPKPQPSPTAAADSTRPTPATMTTAAHSNPSPTPQPSASAAMPDRAELRRRLTPEQYHVTCEEGTEPPFRNAYWNEHRPGIYVDVITGRALFSSLDKFDSGTGWPSFTKPLEQREVKEKTDSSLGMDRTEVRSNSSDAHLGHVFDDGPRDRGGKRYCMNSIALDLEEK